MFHLYRTEQFTWITGLLVHSNWNSLCKVSSKLLFSGIRLISTFGLFLLSFSSKISIRQCNRWTATDCTTKLPYLARTRRLEFLLLSLLDHCTAVIKVVLYLDKQCAHNIGVINIFPVIAYQTRRHFVIVMHSSMSWFNLSSWKLTICNNMQITSMFLNMDAGNKQITPFCQVNIIFSLTKMIVKTE